MASFFYFYHKKEFDSFSIFLSKNQFYILGGTVMEQSERRMSYEMPRQTKSINL